MTEKKSQVTIEIYKQNSFNKILQYKYSREALDQNKENV